ncbi:BppU family phage baseplate upper protein, partial [Clostridium sp.]|uniref:BppU family phage baseplate upper protein n=1 Tax=Clostridium sp. TaxID=1506 RepID=UPI001A4252D0
MINTINHNINIDLINKINMNKSINIKQNDTDSHNFKINIYNNSVGYDLTGLTAKIYFLKADNTKIFQDCTLDDAINGKMNCILSTQTLSFVGIVSAEITIYGTSGEVLTSITFDFNVTKVLRDDLAIESTSEFTALTTALNSIEAALVSVPTVEALKI